MALHQDLKPALHWTRRRAIELLALILWLVSSYSAAYGEAETEIRNEWAIDVEAPATATFLNVNVYQANRDSVYVAGRVRREFGSGSKGGYVMISLFHPRDSLTPYYQKTSNYLLLHSDRRSMGEYFRFDIPFIPDKSTRIVLRYFKKEETKEDVSGMR